MLNNLFFDLNWDKVKKEFILDNSFIHLALCMLAPNPERVRNAIEKHRKELDLNPALYYRNKDYYEDRNLRVAAEYLKTNYENIAMTESTTMGLAIIYGGMQLSDKDEILSTVHEHYAAREIIRFKTISSNVQSKTIQLYKDPSLVNKEEIINNILNNITPQTRVLGLTWVHSSTGVKLPIKEICQAIEKLNLSRTDDEKILTLVDGVHAFGVEEINIEDLHCDFFIAGCHKWLFGPRGTGLVWGSKRGWKRITPIITSFKGEAFWPWYKNIKPEVNNCPPAYLCTPGGFQAYENRWSLAEAFEFHQWIGQQNVKTKITSFANQCKKRISEMKNIRLITPLEEELSSGLVCFEVKGMEPDVVVEKLLEKKIISGQTPYHTSFVRFAPSIINTKEEIDIALEGLDMIQRKAI